MLHKVQYNGTSNNIDINFRSLGKKITLEPLLKNLICISKNIFKYYIICYNYFQYIDAINIRKQFIKFREKDFFPGLDMGYMTLGPQTIFAPKRHSPQNIGENSSWIIFSY